MKVLEEHIRQFIKNNVRVEKIFLTTTQNLRGIEEKTDGSECKKS